MPLYPKKLTPEQTERAAAQIREHQRAFIKQLAQYLAGNQAERSIRLSMGDANAKEWAALRALTPVYGYPTVEEAEEISAGVVGAVSKLSPEDREKLEKLIAWVDEDEEREERLPRGPFEDMLKRDRALSLKQHQWVLNVYERTFNEPQYVNLASSGKLVIGRKVETPEVLKNLPLKPPGRR